MWDQHNKLYYYTWPAPKNHFYEIDFLLSRGSKLCPVEVKSSGYNTHTSLDELSCSTSVKRVTKSSRCETHRIILVSTEKELNNEMFM